MEATPQDLQASAETRQALKRRREELTSTGGGNTKVRAVPVLKHDVEIPEGFDVESIKLDPSKHGEALPQTHRLRLSLLSGGIVFFVVLLFKQQAQQAPHLSCFTVFHSTIPMIFLMPSS